MSLDPRDIVRFDAGRSFGHQPFRAACYAPFVSMYFHTNGDVVACCKSAHHRLGNVTRQRLRDIWTGERMAAMREALRDYRMGDACRFCAWQVQGQQDHVHAKIYDPLEVTDLADPWPRRMDFTMSNVCNLACVMCYGVLSSTIRARRDRLPPLPRVYGDQFFDDLRPFLSRLQHTTFMGGEPFLAVENFRVWDMMIEQRVTPRTHVITNGTQWNPRIERVLAALPMDISVSIDGTTPETVESVRVNAKFSTVMTNVARFHEYSRRRGVRMSLMFCLMRQNWREFGPYLRLAEEMDVDVDINVVVDPSDCSLHTMPAGELAQVSAELERIGSEGGFGELPRNGWIWRRTIEDLVRAAGRVGERLPPVHPVVAAEDPVAAAWRLLGEGDAAAARHKLMAVDPLDVADRQYELLVCRAHAERAHGDFVAAESTLDQAILLWDRSPSAYVERGWLHLARQQGEAALAAAQAARERIAHEGDPSVATQTLRIQASAWMLLGRAGEAIECLRGIPLDDPCAYDVACNESWFCRVAGRLDEAQAAIERARAAAPNRVQAWLEQAWLEHSRGRPAAALRAVDEGIARVGESRRVAEMPGLLVAQAVCMRAIGDLVGARSALADLSALRPGDPWAASQLRSLDFA